MHHIGGAAPHLWDGVGEYCCTVFDLNACLNERREIIRKVRAKNGIQRMK